MGGGAADVAGPLAAGVGELDAVAPDSTPALAVPNGGLLCALPALLAVNLLKGVERYLSLPEGDYGLDSLLLRLAFTALARLESIEFLRDSAPGAWGKLLGLDRVAEVRTLRAKIQLLVQEDAPGQWSAALCERWMAAAPEHSGVLYIDGHVRVYNGSQTQLPRHCVARQRLCLRALYTSEADRLPDPEAGILTVRLHHSANVATDQVIEKLCEEPNATETVFPRTNLGLGAEIRLDVNSARSGHLKLEIQSPEKYELLWGFARFTTSDQQLFFTITPRERAVFERLRSAPSLLQGSLSEPVCTMFEGSAAIYTLMTCRQELLDLRGRLRSARQFAETVSEELPSSASKQYYLESFIHNTEFTRMKPHGDCLHRVEGSEPLPHATAAAGCSADPGPCQEASCGAALRTAGVSPLRSRGFGNRS
jgi:hypothetical protein